jgi:hypothetical protein
MYLVTAATHLAHINLAIFNSKRNPKKCIQQALYHNNSIGAISAHLCKCDEFP